MSQAAPAELIKTQPQAADQAAKEPTRTQTPVTELRVSAHLMRLDSGLFCVFPAPGSPPPDPVSGLPGIWITPDPGSAGRPDAVSIRTFRDDGWLNGTAALVQVTDGSAQILVTIYQTTSQMQQAAPRLQVLRLSEEASTTTSELKTMASPGVVGAAEANPEVSVHIQRTGDVTGRIGAWIGRKGSQLWIEGFGLVPANGLAREEIEYQGVLGREWLSPWVEGGQFCGSRGMALPLLGLNIRLKGKAAAAFECAYTATFVDGSTVGPVRAGEICAADSLAALEAFQIVVSPRTGKANTLNKKTADKKSANKKTAPAVARAKTAQPKPTAAKLR